MREARFWLALCAVSTILCGWGFSQSPQTRPTDQQLLDEVRALRAEVKDLRAQLKAQQPATQPAQSPPTTDTAGPALRDAQQRSQLFEMESMTAGYLRDRGFIIRSDDGDFLLHPWAFFQVRNTTNYREPAANGKGTDLENGFELPRAKLILDGNLFGPDLTYQMIWATSDTTGNLGLQDAWARYHFPGTPWAVQAGQIRDPFDHEQIIFGTKTLTPERSIVNNLLANGDGIVKGADVAYGFDTPSPVRAEVAITNGMRNFDTTFQNYPTNPATWGAAGRVEWKLTGDWNDYTQFTALGNKQDLLVLGGGTDYTEADGAGSLMYVGDAQFDSPSGLMVYAAYLGRYTRHNAGLVGTNGTPTGTGHVTTANTYDSTVRLLAAYLIGQRFEPFARYEYLHFDPHELPSTAAHDQIHDISLGFNYYFEGHRAKITAAASYLPNGSAIANTASDLLTASKKELIVQAQFQIII